MFPEVNVRIAPSQLPIQLLKGASAKTISPTFQIFATHVSLLQFSLSATRAQIMCFLITKVVLIACITTMSPFAINALASITRGLSVFLVMK